MESQITLTEITQTRFSLTKCVLALYLRVRVRVSDIGQCGVSTVHTVHLGLHVDALKGNHKTQ